MSRIDTLLPQIAALDPAERAELRVALNRGDAPAHPSVVSTPGVCGAAARLIRTRVPIWSLERMRQLGFSTSDLLASYPTLKEIDLEQAWSYVAHRREEIEAVIRENESE